MLKSPVLTIHTTKFTF